jgi:hypothetical protein
MLIRPVIPTENMQVTDIFWTYRNYMRLVLHLVYMETRYRQTDKQCTAETI